jgi:multiple sugar transport system permease protein
VADSTDRSLISAAQLNRHRIAYRVVLTLVVVIFTLVFIGPLYFLFSDGLKSTTEAVQVPPTIVPAHVHPGTYLSAWSRVGLGRLLVNTLYYAFGALALQLVFDVAAAYSLSRLRPVLGNVIFALMLATLMIPAAVLVVPQYVTISDLPLLHLNLIGSPAAAIDGASALRTLRSVVLPISRPIIGVVSIFSLVAVWKDFLWPLLVEYGYNPNRETLNVGIFEAASTTPQNLVLAASAMAAVPTLMFFLVFQRNILSGLTAGSLKG